MKKLTQTTFHSENTRGNCLATVIACFLDCDNVEDVIQIQNHFDTGEDWADKLFNWLWDNGWEKGCLRGHLLNNEFYLVTGVSPRNPKVKHICIYQNGKLWHDPHPDGTGILTEEIFEYLEKIKL